MVYVEQSSCRGFAEYKFGDNQKIILLRFGLWMDCTQENNTNGEV